MTGSIGRPSDDTLWRSVEDTLRTVVLPAVDDEFARSAVIQLVGMVRYARERGDDPSEARIRALSVALDELAAAGHLRSSWPRDAAPHPKAVYEVAAAELAAVVARTDSASAAVRQKLRPLLVADLDADLAGNAVLLDAFRGKLPAD